MTKIHPTALISKEAKIGKDVEIGPYSVVGPNVTIGNFTKLKSHVVVDGFTHIGEHCLIYPGACLGEAPQFKKFDFSIRSYLKIGNHNIIREHVTMHAGTTEGSETRVGDRNYIMVSSHIGHDCQVGNDIVIANGCALGGHVRIEDNVMIGGLSGIHQFVRVGQFAMIGGMSKVVMDIVPFSLCDGSPVSFKGHNIVGLRRAGFLSKDAMIIKKALKALLGSGANLSKATEAARKEYKNHKEVQAILSFIETSKRGLTRSDMKESQED